MRKVVAKSSNVHPKNEGLFIYNHALFMNEKDSSYKITNIVHKAKPFSKLFTAIQEKVAITGTQSLSYSAELLASGAIPDNITQKYPIIQPRVGYLRIWKNYEGSDLYFQFLDTYNNNTVGRPTDLIAHTATDKSQGAGWNGSLNFILNFHSADMILGYIQDLSRGYWDTNDGWSQGSLIYDGDDLSLYYKDIAVSWCRVFAPTPSDPPWTWVCLDEGYTGRNWVPILNGTDAQWVNSYMAQRFADRYYDCYINIEQIINQGIYTEGITQISLDIGDIKFILEKSDTDYVISFTGNSLTSKEISLNCKLIAGDIVKIFNPLKGTSDIRFSGNSKIEIISRGSYTTKQEIFINDANKKLMLITEKLF